MTNKRFLKFQLILLILLAISLIGNTFSWANRPAVQGGGFMNSSDNDYAALKLVTPEYYINGTGCTAVTYTGECDAETGKITYDDEIEEPGHTPTPVVTFTDDELINGEVHYFKTVITNPTEVKTSVSLFISGYTHNLLGASTYLGVSTPISINGSIPTIDNVQDRKTYKLTPVVTQFEVPAAKDGTPATAKIEWFVSNNADNNNTEGKFHISEIVFTNN